MFSFMLIYLGPVRLWERLRRAPHGEKCVRVPTGAIFKKKTQVKIVRENKLALKKLSVSLRMMKYVFCLIVFYPFQMNRRTDVRTDPKL